jgi:hypothetical protein
MLASSKVPTSKTVERHEHQDGGGGETGHSGEHYADKPRVTLGFVRQLRSPSKRPTHHLLRLWHSATPDLSPQTSAGAFSFQPIS